jgi:F-type H+-transporting ATPase subunit delta
MIPLPSAGDVDPAGRHGVVREALARGDAGPRVAQLDEQARNLIATLAANRRLSYLPEIAARYEQLRADAERTVEVTVTSAVALSAEQRTAYTTALSKRLGRQVHLHCETDPSLLGGAVVRADDLVIDGSVRAGLSQLAAATAS